MRKILFVCHGNICRSPMAEFVMKNLIEERNLTNEFEISSAATSTEEIGSPVYPPVKDLLQNLGIDCSEKRARQMESKDYDKYDEIYVMDFRNIRNIAKICTDRDHKIKLLRSVLYNEDDIEDIGAKDLEVEDPWYTRNFKKVYDMILEACLKILEE